MRRLGCLFALALLSACSMTAPSPSPEPSPSSPGSQQSGSASPRPGDPSGSPVAVPPARLAAITADLRTRGVRDEVAVVSAESVRFNDGSLGCPQPGVQYTQAQVDGMRVVVEAGGRQYDYRFGRTDKPRLCQNPSARPTR